MKMSKTFYYLPLYVDVFVNIKGNLCSGKWGKGWLSAGGSGVVQILIQIPAGDLNRVHNFLKAHAEN